MTADATDALAQALPHGDAFRERKWIAKHTLAALAALGYEVRRFENAESQRQALIENELEPMREYAIEQAAEAADREAAKGFDRTEDFPVPSAAAEPGADE